MNNITQLFIRATKRKNSIQRVQSVYKRFYGRYPDNDMNSALVHVLSDICDKYLRIKLVTLMSDMNAQNHWKFGIEADDDYSIQCIKILTSYIRLTEKTKFKGLSTPLMFKRK